MRIRIKPKKYGLEDIIPFGMYKGMYVQDVIEKHPRYMEWLVYDKDIILLNKKALNELDEALEDAEHEDDSWMNY